MTAADWVVALSGLVALAGAAGAVASRVLLHAVAMWVVSLLGTAGCFVALRAPVAGGLVLVGGMVAAFAVLLVTARVTRAPLDRHDDFDVSWARRVGAVVAGGVSAVLLGVALVETVGWHAVPVAASRAAALATGLFGTWWWALVLAVVTVVVCLVAALGLSGTGEDA